MLSSIAIFLAEKNPDKAILIYVISGVLGTVFYAYLLYLVRWEQGAKDRIRADAGRISPRPHFGLKIAVAFSLPMIIPGAIYFLVSLVREVFSVNNAVLNGISNVSVFIAYILSMPFVGFALALFGQLGKHIAEAGQTLPYSIYMLASVIPGIIFIWGAYYFGYRGKFMSRVFRPKKKNDL